MDELGEAYDEAVLEIVREWEKEDDEHFGAIWYATICVCGTIIDHVMLGNLGQPLISRTIP